LRLRQIVEGCGSLGTLLCVLLALAPSAESQQSDVPLPPRLDTPARPQPGAPSTAPVRVPDGARLAPLPEERAATEEIVVLGQSEWRLPDLGSSWRAEQEAEEAREGIRATFLPLYDPDNPPTRSDTFLLDREAQQRLGFIELFRVRFGRRSTDEAR
jgi:hypothetical protein